MFANATVKAHILVTALPIASIGAVANLSKTVTVPGANFAVGDGVVVVPNAAFTAGLSFYGIVTGATTLAIVFVNASAGAIDPADTFNFDIYVLGATGNKTTVAGV